MDRKNKKTSRNLVSTNITDDSKEADKGKENVEIASHRKKKNARKSEVSNCLVKRQFSVIAHGSHNT